MPGRFLLRPLERFMTGIVRPNYVGEDEVRERFR